MASEHAITYTCQAPLAGELASTPLSRLRPFKILQKPFFIRELPGRAFGIDQFTINDNFEDTAARFNQCNVCVENLPEFFRQTGGA